MVHGSKEFLPHLIASGDGALVNISSLFGLVSVPGQSAYNATKYAVRGLTEAIREEMLVGRPPGHRHLRAPRRHPHRHQPQRAQGRRPRRLRAIDALFEKKLAKMSPDRAAEIILDGALAGKARVLVGLDAHVIHHFAKLAGSRYQDVVARLTARMPLR